jgi:hypothetical protein
VEKCSDRQCTMGVKVSAKGAIPQRSMGFPMLAEVPIIVSDRPLSQVAIELIEQGRSRFRTVDCFDFVPSNYDLSWRVLDALPRGRFCEWGSGFGIVTGMAEILGFDARGIEINPKLADASRQLFVDLGLTSRIQTGDYLANRHEADVYFVYCWPGMLAATEECFLAVAPAGAKLLICHGQSDIRCKVRCGKV